MNQPGSLSAYGGTRLGWPVYLAGVLAALLLAGLAMLSPWAALGLAVMVVSITVAFARPFLLLALLVLALPFHVFATRVMGGPLNLSPRTVELFSYWKEGAMALLAAVLLWRRVFGQDRFRVRLYPFDVGLACIALMMGVYVFVGPRLNVGIYGFRNYLEPLVVLYLLRAVPATRKELRWLVVGILAVCAVMAVFGIYQVRAWNFADLYNWGFHEADGTIPNAFYTAEVERQPHLRAVSTVTSPNELGLMLMLAIAIALVLAMQPQRPLWQRYSLLGFSAVAGICILYTYSRSTLIGVVVMVMALAVLEVGVSNLGRAVRYMIRSPGMILALLLLLVMLVIGANRVGLTARITRAISLNDPSAVGHLASYEASIPFILANPLGIGTGMAGPRALKFSDQVKIEHVESSYLQMMMEIGIPGTLFVLAVLLLMVWTLRGRRGKFDPVGSSEPVVAAANSPNGRGDPFFAAINIAAQAAWLGAMAAFAFLPLMQELQLMSYLWVVVAIPLVAARAT